MSLEVILVENEVVETMRREETNVLFNLQTDPLESRNFADSALDVVARLTQYLPPGSGDLKFDVSGPQPG